MSLVELLASRSDGISRSSETRNQGSQELQSNLLKWLSMCSRYTKQSHWEECLSFQGRLSEEGQLRRQRLEIQDHAVQRVNHSHHRNA